MSEEVALVLAVMMRKLHLASLTISYDELIAAADTRVMCWQSLKDGGWTVSAQSKASVIEAKP